jgi:hypothetical protein
MIKTKHQGPKAKCYIFAGTKTKQIFLQGLKLKVFIFIFVGTIFIYKS